MSLVIFQRVACKTNPHARHHAVALPDAPTAPRAKGAHQRDVERSYPDRLIENWSKSLDERQEIRHPVGKT